jgi:hypothetical protein
MCFSRENIEEAVVDLFPSRVLRGRGSENGGGGDGDSV